MWSDPYSPCSSPATAAKISVAPRLVGRDHPGQLHRDRHARRVVVGAGGVGGGVHDVRDPGVVVTRRRRRPGRDPGTPQRCEHVGDHRSHGDTVAVGLLDVGLLLDRHPPVGRRGVRRHGVEDPVSRGADAALRVVLDDRVCRVPKRGELADVGLDPPGVDGAQDAPELGVRHLRAVRAAGAVRPVLSRIVGAGGVRGGRKADEGGAGSGRGARQEDPARGMCVFPRVLKHSFIPTPTEGDVKGPGAAEVTGRLRIGPGAVRADWRVRSRIGPWEPLPRFPDTVGVG